MSDPVIRPTFGLLLIALQSAQGVAATPSPLTDVVAFETDSADYSSPYRSEQTNESTGSFATGAPMVIGQPATIGFRARLRGAGSAYTATVKPPLHAALSACGWLGQYTASVSAAALTAGTAFSATLGTGFAATAQTYRGMPLNLTGAPAAGRTPLVTSYSAARIAQLSESYGASLTVANQAALPANWTYAPTSPQDAAARNSMHPYATIYLYEDGTLHIWTDCHGIVDFDGASARPGFAAFSFSGVYQGRSDAPIPTNAVYPSQAAPLLVQGTGANPAFQVNRRPLAISRWSIRNGGAIESPEDPNTTFGFGPGEITDRTHMLEIDPLMTQVAVRNAIAEIASGNRYSSAIQMAGGASNSVSILMPVIQPVEATPTMRGKLRAETLRYQAVPDVRDAAGRDSDAILCFY